MQFPFRKCILLIGWGVQGTFYADAKHQRCRNSIRIMQINASSTQTYTKNESIQPAIAKIVT